VCADLVSTHEADVALDIRCEDSDEASADFRRVGHARTKGTCAISVLRMFRPVNLASAFKAGRYFLII